MGNTTVTPAQPPDNTINYSTPGQPYYYENYPYHYYAPPTQSPTVPVASNTFTTVVPEASTTNPTSDIDTNPVNSPKLVTPVASPKPVTPVASPTPAVPVTSRDPADPVVSPKHGSRTASPPPGTSVESPTPVIPIVSQTPAVKVATPPPVATNFVSRKSPVRNATPPTAFSVVSPTLAVSIISTSPSINDPHTKSSNLIFTTSPDTPGVFPRITTPTTPVRSVVQPANNTPFNSTTSTNNLNSTALIPNNVHVTSKNSIPSTTAPIKSITPHPPDVNFKRTTSKTSIKSSTSSFRQPKPLTLSSAQRSKKWHKFDQEQREKQNEPLDTVIEAPKPSIFAEALASFNDNQTTKSEMANIKPVPSYTLRTTAVCNSFQDDEAILERSQSIHSNISLFKFYLDQKESDRSTGNHTKATMFKMNTLLKQTPLPIPTLSLFTRNFSDGTHEMDTDSTSTPTFRELGLEQDLGTEPISLRVAKHHLNEIKQQRQKNIRPSSLSEFNSNSNNSTAFASSTSSNIPNFSTAGNTFVLNNRPPLSSILKKPSSQVNNDPTPIQSNKNYKPSRQTQENQEPDFENYQSTVSFRVSSPSKTANASILRSEKLLSKRSTNRKN